MGRCMHTYTHSGGTWAHAKNDIYVFKHTHTHTHTHGRSMLLDVLMLAECDYFVGTLSSQMSRLALVLMSQRLGGIPPFVSVEGVLVVAFFCCRCSQMSRWCSCPGVLAVGVEWQFLPLVHVEGVRGRERECLPARTCTYVRACVCVCACVRRLLPFKVWSICTHPACVCTAVNRWSCAFGVSL